MMRCGKILFLLSALVLFMLAARPTPAEAQPGIVRGILSAPFRMMAPGIPRPRMGQRGRHHRQAAHPRRGKAVVARPNAPAGAAAGAGAAGAAAAAGAASGDAADGAAAATPDRAETTGMAPGQDAMPRGAAMRAEPARSEPGWAGPLYWPHASDDLFDYVLRRSGDRFWARGGRDFTDAVFMRDAKADDWTDLCGSRLSDVNAWRQPIAEAVQPADAQRGALDALAAALNDAANSIKTHCPDAKAVARPTQRLDAMTDRLWGMRQAVVLLRGPLEKFLKTLDERQKTLFNDMTAEAGAAGGSAAAMAMQLCADPSAMAPWPNEQIERRLRPSNEQRQAFQTLQMTAQGMSQQLMASCPKDMPPTALERLDAAEKRLNAMLYAARVVAPSLRAFAEQLKPDQKARFEAPGPDARTSRR